MYQVAVKLGAAVEHGSIQCDAFQQGSRSASLQRRWCCANHVLANNGSRRAARRTEVTGGGGTTSGQRQRDNRASLRWTGDRRERIHRGQECGHHRNFGSGVGCPGQGHSPSSAAVQRAAGDSHRAKLAAHHPSADRRDGASTSSTSLLNQFSAVLGSRFGRRREHNQVAYARSGSRRTEPNRTDSYTGACHGCTPREKSPIPYPHYPHGSRGGPLRLAREGECPGTVAFISCLDSEIDDLGVIL